MGRKGEGAAVGARPGPDGPGAALGTSSSADADFATEDRAGYARQFCFWLRNVEARAVAAGITSAEDVCQHVRSNLAYVVAVQPLIEQKVPWGMAVWVQVGFMPSPDSTPGKGHVHILFLVFESGPYIGHVMYLVNVCMLLESQSLTRTPLEHH